MFVVQAIYDFEGVQQSLQPNSDQLSKSKQQQQQKELPQLKISFLTFKKGQKIITKKSYQNGWWYGCKLISSQKKEGFFPSTFVRIGPPPPPPQIQLEKIKRKRDQQQLKQLEEKAKMGAMPSQYYQGITGYKRIKIDQHNQNILKASFIKIDKATGMALVPIKDQSPASKAVRHMGYYFDYHQWIEKKNKQKPQKRRPDPSKKKRKKLKLKLK